MDVEGIYHTSNVYQVPLDERSITLFKSPENQTPESFNCGVVSAQLIGLITYAESLAQTDASRYTGSNFLNIIEFINKIHDEISEFNLGEMPITSETILTFLSKIFPGFATIILATRPPPINIGHFFIFFKDKTGQPYILDAQAKLSYKGIQNITNYFLEKNLTEKLLYIKSPLKTADNYTSLYTEHELSRMIHKQCKIGGRKHRVRKNGKKTKKSRKHHGVRTRRRRH
jgi:hypothetical protein